MAMTVGTASGSKTVTPTMNVTPLVDVVLVLLIIFMVVTPALQQDVQLDLPGIFNPDPQAEGNVDPIKVSVAKAGEFHMDGQKYDLEGIAQALTDVHIIDPARRVLLRADQKLPYREVRGIMARVQQIGFPGLSFGVGEKHRAGGPVAAESPAADAATPADAPAPSGDAPAPAATEG